ncbi:MAG: hypothetical protein KDA44_10620 [Planctomycetales bacterium]|nr:hypothetical protein [Planctomycetales bacterium]
MWQLDGNVARLVDEQCQAVLKLDEPFHGLSEWTVAGEQLADNLLAIRSDAETTPFDWPVVDAYVRGNDLAVSYGTTMSRPFSLQIYWSALNLPPAVAAIEAVVSVQTELLQTHPGFALVSNLPTAASPRDFALADGAVLLHVGQSWSIAELAPPTDFARGEAIENPAGGVTTRWRLEPEFLEKGVIRRVRVRTLVLPRSGDVKAAQQCYDQLCAERPPLTV